MGGQEKERRSREKWQKSDGRKVGKTERWGWRQGGAKIRIEVGSEGVRCGEFFGRPVSDNVTWHTLLILAQRRDPASPSAQGQGRSKGSASHPPPLLHQPTHPHSYTHTYSDTESPLPSVLAWQTPGQARVHFHKTIASQPAPVSGGWG